MQPVRGRKPACSALLRVPGNMTLWGWHTPSWTSLMPLVPCLMRLILHQPHLHQRWRLNQRNALTSLPHLPGHRRVVHFLFFIESSWYRWFARTRILRLLPIIQALNARCMRVLLRFCMDAAPQPASTTSSSRPPHLRPSGSAPVAAVL